LCTILVYQYCDRQVQEFHKSECVPSQHYGSTAICVSVVQCNKPTQKTFTAYMLVSNLWWWLCLWCGHVVLTSPEGLLILYKSGIFAIDTSIVNFQTWPRHRDDLGVYWKRQKRTFQSPSRPARSYAICSRGIHASTCKEFWLQSITFLPVAAGKNLINCYSIYILKMGRVYIETCKKLITSKWSLDLLIIPLWLYRILKLKGVTATAQKCNCTQGIKYKLLHDLHNIENTLPD
jgi:hypothetical protein